MSSSKLNNQSSSRDYGATHSRSDNNLPDVNFSGFSPTEVVSLSDDIGNNIITINANIRKLERMLKDIGTQNDHQYKRVETKTIMEQTNQRIDTTSADLKRLSSVVSRSDKQQKLQFEKLTNEFRNTYEKYAKTQRHILGALRQSISFLKVDEENNEQLEDNDLPRVFATQTPQQQEMQILIERRKDVIRIESDMERLNTLMHSFASEVHAQGIQVNDIERHVEDAAVNVEEGTAELRKAVNHRQSSRRRILILLIIAVIVGLIVTGIIVVKIKS